VQMCGYDKVAFCLLSRLGNSLSRTRRVRLLEKALYGGDVTTAVGLIGNGPWSHYHVGAASLIT
jgi:hypothetical protein